MRTTSWSWRPSKGGFAAEVAKVGATLPQGMLIEIWFQDEARVGQENTITCRWAKRSTRPSAAKDPRLRSAYMLGYARLRPGAICLEEGKGAGLVLSLCKTETMKLRRTEIARAGAPSAHTVVLMDQAGWHMTGKLKMTANISIVALPAKCFELDPLENVGQFMHDNWLSNRFHIPRQHRRPPM